MAEQPNETKLPYPSPQLPPAVQAAEAIAQTIIDPSAANILADVQLAITLITTLKAHLDSKHPSIWNTIKGLF